MKVKEFKAKDLDEVVDVVIKTVSEKCVREHGEHLATFEEIHTITKHILTDWLESDLKLTCPFCECVQWSLIVVAQRFDINGEQPDYGSRFKGHCNGCKRLFQIKLKQYATEKL